MNTFEHKKSVDLLLEESQESNNLNNENINSFWNLFEILTFV